MWMFPRIGGFPPKSSILIGFSIINHPFWGTPIFGNTHVGIRIVDVYGKCTINIIPVPWIRHGYRKREKKLGSSKHLITKEYKTEHCCRLKKNHGPCHIHPHFVDLGSFVKLIFISILSAFNQDNWKPRVCCSIRLWNKMSNRKN